MDKNEKGFTVNDLKEIYAAAWDVGACNLRGLANDLPLIVSKGRYEQDLAGVNTTHVAVKLFMGQMGYLAGIMLGPEPEWAEAVKQMIAERSCQESNCSRC